MAKELPKYLITASTDFIEINKRSFGLSRGYDAFHNAWVWLADDNGTIVEYWQELNDKQKQQQQELMHMPMREWPVDLYQKAYDECKIVGMSGDVLASVVEKWILENE